MGQGIDVLLSGTKLQDFFSASLKIVKNVVGAEDNTFTFRVKALNENIVAIEYLQKCINIQSIFVQFIQKIQLNVKILTQKSNGCVD